MPHFRLGSRNCQCILFRFSTNERTIWHRATSNGPSTVTLMICRICSMVRWLSTSGHNEMQFLTANFAQIRNRNVLINKYEPIGILSRRNEMGLVACPVILIEARRFRTCSLSFDSTSNPYRALIISLLACLGGMFQWRRTEKLCDKFAQFDLI